MYMANKKSPCKTCNELNELEKELYEKAMNKNKENIQKFKKNIKKF